MASLSFVGYYLSLFIQLAATILILNIPNSCCHGHLKVLSENHAALFIFGDSLFDAGNNNYINTTTEFQANFWPYGETFFNYPTGRPSDGRLIPDFIAEYAKLPLLPPNKQPGYVHQYTNGVNFASSGAGALAETNQGMVIDLNTQVIYFNNFKKLLKKLLGNKEEAEKMLSRAVYLFSCGSNDYPVPFMPNYPLFQLYSQEEYVAMVVGNLTAAIKEIYKTGGRKFGFVSLGPTGCLPPARAAKNGQCDDQVTAIVKLHNTAFSKALEELETKLQGFKYSNFDFNTTLSERMNNPSKYGFKEGKSGCCGTGPYRGSHSCGGMSEVKEFQLCNNASEYIFFDSTHPTEMTNQQISKLMWSGSAKVARPYNLKALFEDV